MSVQNMIRCAVRTLLLVLRTVLLLSHLNKLVIEQFLVLVSPLHVSMTPLYLHSNSLSIIVFFSIPFKSNLKSNQSQFKSSSFIPFYHYHFGNHCFLITIPKMGRQFPTFREYSKKDTPVPKMFFMLSSEQQNMEKPVSSTETPHNGLHLTFVLRFVSINAANLPYVCHFSCQSFVFTIIEI